MHEPGFRWLRVNGGGRVPLEVKTHRREYTTVGGIHERRGSHSLLRSLNASDKADFNKEAY